MPSTAVCLQLNAIVDEIRWMKSAEWNPLEESIGWNLPDSENVQSVEYIVLNGNHSNPIPNRSGGSTVLSSSDVATPLFSDWPFSFLHTHFEWAQTMNRNEL